MTRERIIDDSQLPQVPGGWRNEPVAVGDRIVHLAVPVDPDLLLDLPETLAEHNADDYMPYWAWLWPAAIDMAHWVIGQQWAVGTEALELGCGLGLVGMAATSAGLTVTLSDYRDEALAVVNSNLKRNQMAGVCEKIDWRNPPARTWPIVLACDVLYEVANHTSILEFVANALPADGVCWIGEPGRVNANRFLKSIKNDGRLVTTQCDGSPLKCVRVGEFVMIRLARVRS